MTGADAVGALLHIARSVSPLDLARAVYGDDADPGYLSEKAAHIKRDFLGWCCYLDTVRLRRLAVAIEGFAAVSK